MSDEINRARRRFFGTAAMTLAAAQLAFNGKADAQPSKARPAGLRSVKPGAHTSFASLKQIDAGVLNVGYAEAGPADGPAVMLLHGWPYDIYSFVDVAPLLAAEGYRVIIPYLRGYDKYRREFSKLIWQLASPKWNFDDATFDRSAKALDNPDHVAIVIHNYRWRQDLAEGESKYDDLEKKLAPGPVINVPTITMEGDANGAPHPEPAAYAKMFSARDSHRTITGGIGHNLTHEASPAI